MNEQAERLAWRFVQVRVTGYSNGPASEWAIYLEGAILQKFDDKWAVEFTADRLRAALVRFAEELEREREP